MAELDARPSPLRRFLNAVERGTAQDVLDEVEIHTARAVLGDDSLVDPDLDEVLP